jgi:hypothetical protein
MMKIITTWMQEGEVTLETTDFFTNDDPHLYLLVRANQCVETYENNGVSLVEKIMRGPLAIDLFPSGMDAACKIRIEQDDPQENNPQNQEAARLTVPAGARVGNIVDFLRHTLASCPDYPCRVDEMTAREIEINKVASHLCGAIQFLLRDLE